MPHSVKDQTETQAIHQRNDQPSPPPSALAEHATQQQSPMLKAWSDELDPRNLTINEALFLCGLVCHGEERDAGGNPSADGTRL